MQQIIKTIFFLSSFSGKIKKDKENNSRGGKTAFIYHKPYQIMLGSSCRPEKPGLPKRPQKRPAWALHSMLIWSLGGNFQLTLDRLISILMTICFLMVITFFDPSAPCSDDSSKFFYELSKIYLGQILLRWSISYHLIFSKSLLTLSYYQKVIHKL